MKTIIDRNVDRLDHADGPSDKEIHDEIITEFNKYTCSESESEDMFEWTQENGWENYCAINQWMNVQTLKVVSTKNLYKIYCDGK